MLDKAGMGKPGKPNTLWAMVKEATEELVRLASDYDHLEDRTSKDRVALKTALAELEKCRARFMALPDGWGEALPASTSRVIRELTDLAIERKNKP